jgi:probable HAF family extracellular repeat protein
MRHLLASFAAGVLVSSVAPGRVAAQTYTYTTIEVPGARLTTANGINDRGQIVGDFTVGASAAHGFLRSNGVFTTIDVPGADTTRAQGINNLGQIVGTYTVGPRRLAFLLDRGRFIGLTPSGATEGWTYGINDYGQVVGGYTMASGSHNFLWTHGRFVDLDVPGAQPLSSSLRLGINRAGQVVGAFQDAADPGVLRGFRLEPDGKLTTLQRGDNRLTVFNAINDRGEIAGASASLQPLLQNGFVFAFGQFSNFSVASSSSPLPAITRPYAINNRGQLVGVYTFDSNNAPNLAFVATPAGLEEDISGSPSPSGTRVPVATIIVDRDLATWTLGAGREVLRNGVLAANGYGSEILYLLDEIYVLGDDDNWWKWMTGTWNFVGPTDPSS